jgi:hypothetical protein
LPRFFIICACTSKAGNYRKARAAIRLWRKLFTRNIARASAGSLPPEKFLMRCLHLEIVCSIR